MQKFLNRARFVIFVLALGLVASWAGEFSHFVFVDHHYCDVHHTWEHDEHEESLPTASVSTPAESDLHVACKTCGQFHQSTFLSRAGLQLIAEVDYSVKAIALHAKVTDFSDRQLSLAPKNSPPGV